ncbi:MAG: bifunctional adenosylcobinamide kinase/adenosylcobinamide-phosphate guanylyltransferase [Thermodesulfobacteriota bacterium]|nr:bifunctional adenosylcobinamide kinase/adenosylcobinamide-phosphate guanylyltransferase [Thermodesulfobacteriota bacterium]
MKEVVLVTGGCRSGKSNFALDLANTRYNGKKYFFATCVPADEEMHDRVRRHQQDRGNDWQTVECPVDIAGALAQVDDDAGVVLIDCLTLWVTNLLETANTQDAMAAQADILCRAITEAPCSVIMVTNEVGCGIVPENSLARMFRDFVGLVNQRMSACSDRVVWMVAGNPVMVKGDPAC